MAPLEILIVGCSIAGPTLATFLLLSPVPASQKPRITILERSRSLRKDGQNIDIRSAGLPIIRKLGLETLVRASTTGEEGVQHLGPTGHVWFSLATDKTGRREGPTSDIEIMRGRMAELCFQRSQTVSADVQAEGGAGIEVIFGDCLDELEQDADKVHVRFARSGLRRSFDLVVGADGLQSTTRKFAFGAAGEENRLLRLGMYGAFFSMPSAPTDTMWRRWLHAPGRRGVMLRPDKQRGRTTAFLYVVNDRDKRLPALAMTGRDNVEGQKATMAEIFQDVGWECPRIIREMKATKDFYYDMVGQVKMDTWSTGRVVLVGDAGYCGSPLSGMGTSLALNGAYHLAGALSRHPGDHAAAFAEYERTMRPLVTRAQKLPPGTPHIMNPETEWGLWMFRAIVSFFKWTGLFFLLFKFASWAPPAKSVPLDDYGFNQLPELEE